MSFEKYKFGLRIIAAGVLFPLCNATAIADPGPSKQHAVSDGARIFADRCVLCHGNYGEGDGFMPLLIKDYPETNLLKAQKSSHFNNLLDHVKWGGNKGKINDKSPPWIDELSPSELESVARFVRKLQENPEQSWQTLTAYLDTKPVSIETGRLVFQTRCANCHGTSGHGDGPMSALVKSPPPSNLVQSQLSETKLVQIITFGGEKLGRSAQMPGWKHELTQAQIDSVIAYVHQLRQ